jgi:hypothetical protein
MRWRSAWCRHDLQMKGEDVRKERASVSTRVARELEAIIVMEGMLMEVFVEILIKDGPGNSKKRCHVMWSIVLQI